MIKIVLNSQALFTYLKIGFLILFIAFKMLGKKMITITNFEIEESKCFGVFHSKYSFSQKHIVLPKKASKTDIEET